MNVHVITRQLEAARMIETTRGDVGVALTTANRAWERVVNRQYASVVELQTQVQTVVDNCQMVLDLLTGMEAANAVTMSNGALKSAGETKTPISNDKT